MNFLIRCYHRIMLTYCAWQIRRTIRKMRADGKRLGLPSLDAYSNEAIIEGFRRLKKNKDD